ncbi:unnamed protein product [Tilletia controversa]|uniref:TauD/TfdA-like domain-containing protein n=3 Tax=Tilletia TaxID=13289 RepID=A0A8X7MU94_9BASI|nr:hypothetical protein CF328_g4747 [Tilletia controversa]KAE8258113.1 hypothetical protein A4X03_0g4476 [Tilletia caries]CAD6954106.1 unnamed protein product [Tilletia laevis]KAE8247827.1 hypothetical protein A4X06_0g4162 [Tilletia controversa]CAD6892128.1 unnamed protein product [Tilletia caries]
MAPIASSTVTAPEQQTVPVKVFQAADKNASEPEWVLFRTASDDNYKYKWALPAFDARYRDPNFKDAPLEPFEHTDVGLRALKHEDPRSFLQNAKVENVTPRFGSAVSGVQLTQLSSDERDQLALFIAERGVAVFYDQQDFIDQTPEQLKEYGRHFSPKLHEHQTSGHPKGHPEFHLVYKEASQNLDGRDERDTFTSSVWHSDISYEAQPASTTFLFLFDSPPNGGDTLYADSEEQLNRLSPSFRSYLRTLTAVHSGFEQAGVSASGDRGGVIRRKPVAHEHPVIRKHPVTGRESLYVNEAFTRHIVGLRKEESDAILKVLFNLTHTTVDAQARIRWAPGAVVIWDNRRTQHTAIADFDAATEGRRHGLRITPRAERPTQ